MESDVQRRNLVYPVHNALELYSPHLLHIKGLFLQRQYRRCITKCREVLNQTLRPLQQTFAQFYLALAHDELARSIHPYSQAKIPAFSQADQLYKESLLYLPTLEQLQDIKSSTEPKHEAGDDPFVDRDLISRQPSSAMLRVGDTPLTSRNARSRGSSLHIRNDSPPAHCAGDLPQDTASDFDNEESHANYGEVMMPNRVVSKLERDYSSMSLLDAQPQAICHGLLQQIPLAMNYHIPPRTLYSAISTVQSRWSRLYTRTGSPVRKQLRAPSERDLRAASPVPPVSPLGSESVASDASTISSLSPNTPTLQIEVRPPDSPTTAARSTWRIEEHLEGMRIQLETHLRLLQEARQRTITIQSERAAARLAPNKGNRHTAFTSWSFTPEDVKAMEKQRRIEAGRERGWARKRFDPTKYMELAETVLSEL